jgi:hypothetical protein
MAPKQWQMCWHLSGYKNNVSASEWHQKNGEISVWKRGVTKTMTL